MKRQPIIYKCLRRITLFYTLLISARNHSMSSVCIAHSESFLCEVSFQHSERYGQDYCFVKAQYSHSQFGPLHTPALIYIHTFVTSCGFIYLFSILIFRPIINFYTVTIIFSVFMSASVSDMIIGIIASTFTIFYSLFELTLIKTTIPKDNFPVAILAIPFITESTFTKSTYIWKYFINTTSPTTTSSIFR
ncbi:hypothetical protein LEP1GSC202_0043 [Leptospira yanagawae serovar Saopaulo str. Sao Paulo = ATCC 700523]|uniref:Uncharacterized protein n=1 Tax=Leptospira yanagawae serovar Saopaulo str. Sao Paulo = ATCC 700523 TaxID=1249483 RepID=A0A5E8H734_9LEPT|nr:hypothetical protein LEP1GSC202_0043 [Leptospira yanagawae serovar Saopaulo str. Sao Paulo = ATCC 700523]